MRTRAPLRVAIAGTGFIGAVHARVRAARRRARSSASPRRRPSARERAAAALRRRARVRHAPRSSSQRRRRRRRPHLHAEPPARAARRGGAGRRQARRSARSRWRSTSPARAARWPTPRPRAGRVAAVPVRLPLLPDGARGARARARRRDRPGPAHPRHLPAGLAAARPRTTTGASTPQLGGASRAFADIGSHWCDLAEFVTGHRITRLCARTLTACPSASTRPARRSRRGDGDGELRAVATEDAAIVQFETDRGAVGSTVISQISAGRKNRLWLEVDGAEEALAFDQEEPETLWVGRREARDADQARPRAPLAARGAPRDAPARPSAGLRGLLRRVRRRGLRRGRRRRAGRRAAGRSPTACAPRASPTRC